MSHVDFLKIEFELLQPVLTYYQLKVRYVIFEHIFVRFLNFSACSPQMKSGKDLRE